MESLPSSELTSSHLTLQISLDFLPFLVEYEMLQHLWLQALQYGVFCLKILLCPSCGRLEY